MGSREGFSLIEAIVAILLGAFLVSAAWMGLAQQRKVLEGMIRRTDGLATIRMARTSLARDVSSADDRTVLMDSDTVGLRVVRGIALPCVVQDPTPNPESLAVRYRGIRNPNPAKDSIRGLTSDGGWVVAKLMNVVELNECDASNGARGLRLLASSDIETLVYVEIFEAGSYHLSGRALRYRGPGGNRQPLTPENVEAASRFQVGGRRLDLILTADEAGPWSISLGPTGPGGGR